MLQAALILRLLVLSPLPAVLYLPPTRGRGRIPMPPEIRSGVLPAHIALAKPLQVESAQKTPPGPVPPSAAILPHVHLRA